MLLVAVKWESQSEVKEKQAYRELWLSLTNCSGWF